MSLLWSYEEEINHMQGFFQTAPRTPLWPLHKPISTSTSHLPLFEGPVRSVCTFLLQVLPLAASVLLHLCSLLLVPLLRRLGNSWQEWEINSNQQAGIARHVPHRWQQLLLLGGHRKLPLVKTLLDLSSRPVATSPSGSCVLALSGVFESGMLLGTAYQDFSHGSVVRQGFGIGMVGALVLLLFRSLLQPGFQFFLVTGFGSAFCFGFWLVSGRLLSDLIRSRLTLHLQASLGLLVHWGLAGPFDPHSLSLWGLLSTHRRLLATKFGWKMSILRSLGCSDEAPVMRFLWCSTLTGGTIADRLLLVLLVAICVGSVTGAFCWHCWWVHFGEPVVKLPLIGSWWVRLQIERERKYAKLTPLSQTEHWLSEPTKISLYC